MNRYIVMGEGYTRGSYSAIGMARLRIYTAVKRLPYTWWIYDNLTNKVAH